MSEKLVEHLHSLGPEEKLDARGFVSKRYGEVRKAIQEAVGDFLNWLNTFSGAAPQPGFEQISSVLLKKIDTLVVGLLKDMNNKGKELPDEDDLQHIKAEILHSLQDLSANIIEILDLDISQEVDVEKLARFIDRVSVINHTYTVGSIKHNFNKIVEFAGGDLRLARRIVAVDSEFVIRGDEKFNNRLKVVADKLGVELDDVKELVVRDPSILSLNRYIGKEGFNPKSIILGGKLGEDLVAPKVEMFLLWLESLGANETPFGSKIAEIFAKQVTVSVYNDLVEQWRKTKDPKMLKATADLDASLIEPLQEITRFIIEKMELDISIAEDAQLFIKCLESLPLTNFSNALDVMGKAYEAVRVLFDGDKAKTRYYFLKDPLAFRFGDPEVLRSRFKDIADFVDNDSIAKEMILSNPRILYKFSHGFVKSRLENLSSLFGGYKDGAVALFMRNSSVVHLKKDTVNKNFADIANFFGSDEKARSAILDTSRLITQSFANTKKRLEIMTNFFGGEESVASEVCRHFPTILVSSEAYLSKKLRVVARECNGKTMSAQELLRIYPEILWFNAKNLPAVVSEVQVGNLRTVELVRVGKGIKLSRYALDYDRGSSRLTSDSEESFLDLADVEKFWQEIEQLIGQEDLVRLKNALDNDDDTPDDILSKIRSHPNERLKRFLKAA